VAYPVDGQQRVLHHVIGQIVRSAGTACERAGERQDRMKEGAIGGIVAALRRRQQLAPIFALAVQTGALLPRDVTRIASPPKQV
jgi:hypothetical protein